MSASEPAQAQIAIPPAVLKLVELAPRFGFPTQEKPVPTASPAPASDAVSLLVELPLRSNRR